MLLNDAGTYTGRRYCFTELHDSTPFIRYCWGDHGGFQLAQPGVLSLWSEYIQNLSASGVVTATGRLALAEPLWVSETPRNTFWDRAP